jgi:hypothetical protein
MYLTDLCNTYHYLCSIANRIEDSTLVKQAFDTRRINQEEEYNPRRNLQYYHRSEEFISEATAKKINVLEKLKNVLDNIKDQYGRSPSWGDSYARVLLSALDKGLRTNEKDGDISISQPGVGSLDYIEELLYVRYRLNFDELKNKTEEELEKIILTKDEELVRKSIPSEKRKNVEYKPELEYENKSGNNIIIKHEVIQPPTESLMEKFFGVVRATGENKNVEREITIKIKDSIND